jgi:hypothetical protein
LNPRIVGYFFAVWIALGASLLSSAASNYIITFRSPFGSQFLWYGLTATEIESAPTWEDLEKSPPLSAKRAIEAAKNAIVRFEKEGLLEALPDTLEWTLEGLTLKPVGGEKWYWLTTFEATPKPGFGMTGISLEISVLVTMDGRVITPSVSEPG